MTDFARTPDAQFEGLDGFPYAPHHHEWHDLRMHYVDEGPADAPVMLMLHGMPTWSYLYRDMIPPIVAAGYRCIAPDHMGFGRSDKPTDYHWYSIARHVEILTSLITALDLQRVTLVCQDWGGPIGLAQAATMPERFERLVIMNTWLHHPGHDYSDAVRNWNAGWQTGGIFDRPCPNVGALPLATAGLIGPDLLIPALLSGEAPQIDGAALAKYRAYAAPFSGMPDEAYNGLRRFPRSIPFDDYATGNGAAQTMHRRVLLGWDKPVHFVWGCADDIFPEDQGRAWAAEMGATFAPIADAHHFLQDTHGTEIARIILDDIAAE